MIKKALLPLLFTLATSANAAVVVIDTDTSWLTTGNITNSDPGSGWNTSLAFDTSGWTSAVVSTADCHEATADCIWHDAVNSATRYSWFRKIFTVSGSITSATIRGGVDDDADIYLNGVKILDDHNGFAQNFGPIDLTPYLVAGDNLIAVLAEDNIPIYGQQHAFAAQLQIETGNNVPEPGSLALLALGLVGLGVTKRREGKGK